MINILLSLATLFLLQFSISVSNHDEDLIPACGSNCVDIEYDRSIYGCLDHMGTSSRYNIGYLHSGETITAIMIEHEEFSGLSPVLYLLNGRGEVISRSDSFPGQRRGAGWSNFRVPSSGTYYLQSANRVTTRNVEAYTLYITKGNSLNIGIPSTSVCNDELRPYVTDWQIIWAAYQEFERGYMIWVSSTNQIYSLTDQNWSIHDDLQQDPGGSFNAPQGRLVPISGFGRLWRRNADLRQQLGWALEDEMGYDLIEWTYSDGTRVLSTVNNQAFYLRPNGDWYLDATNRCGDGLCNTGVENSFICPSDCGEYYPIVSADPSSGTLIDFGEVAAGRTEVQRITIRNVGSDPLIFGSYGIIRSDEVAGVIELGAGGPPMPIAELLAGESAEIAFSCRPRETGRVYRATLVLEHNGDTLTTYYPISCRGG